MSNPSLHKDIGGKQLAFISYMQVIGIILVVVGHSMHEYPDNDMGRTTLLYRMIYSFHMPLFLFVSGFLMVYGMELKGKAVSWRNFVSSKLRRLMVPFVVLTAVTFFPRAMMSGMADDPVTLSVESFRDSFIYTGSLVIPYFWFLQVCFTLLIINFTILHIGRRLHLPDLPVYTALLLIFLITPFASIGTTNTFSLHLTVETGLYFIIGAIYARYYQHINRLFPRNSTSAFAGSAAIFAGLFALTENTSLFPLCTLAGITMCISSSKLLDSHDIRILDHLSGANYIIFLLSWYFNIATQQILHHFVELPWWVYSTLSLLTGIYIPWLIYRHLRSHPENRMVRLAAILLGQRFSKRA